MRRLLDTHILLWTTLKPRLIAPTLQGQLSDRQNQVVRSAVNAWEMSIKHALRRLPEAAPLRADFSAVASWLGEGLRLVALDGHITGAAQAPVLR